MSFEITYRIRARDLLAYIEREFGGVDLLGKHLLSHKPDPVRTIFYEAALRNRERPNKLLTFHRLYLGGDQRHVISAPKIELLEYLMRHPGLGLRELARALERTPATVSEHVEDLERAGFVLRESRGAGRAVALRALPREINIRLTSKEAEAEV